MVAIEAQSDKKVVPRRRKVTIDCVAGFRVWPNTLGEACRPAPSRRRVRLDHWRPRTEQMSSRTPIGKFRSGLWASVVSARWTCSSDVKPLAAVSAIVDAGNKVVLAEGGSYIC